MTSCFPGEDLVPEQTGEGETAAGGRAGEAENGLAVAPSPRPLPPSGPAGLLPARRASPGFDPGRQTAHAVGADAAAAAPHRLPAR